MGTNPNVGKMPNRDLGRAIGSEDDGSDKNNPMRDENIQEIALDPTTDNQPGGGTNFQHETKKDRIRED